MLGIAFVDKSIDNTSLKNHYNYKTFSIRAINCYFFLSSLLKKNFGFQFSFHQKLSFSQFSFTYNFYFF